MQNATEGSENVGDVKKIKKIIQIPDIEGSIELLIQALVGSKSRLIKDKDGQYHLVIHPDEMLVQSGDRFGDINEEHKHSIGIANIFANAVVAHEDVDLKKITTFENLEEGKYRLFESGKNPNLVEIVGNRDAIYMRWALEAGNIEHVKRMLTQKGFKEQKEQAQSQYSWKIGAPFSQFIQKGCQVKEESKLKELCEGLDSPQEDLTSWANQAIKKATNPSDDNKLTENETRFLKRAYVAWSAVNNMGSAMLPSYLAQEQGITLGKMCDQAYMTHAEYHEAYGHEETNTFQEAHLKSLKRGKIAHIQEIGGVKHLFLHGGLTWKNLLTAKNAGLPFVYNVNETLEKNVEIWNQAYQADVALFEKVIHGQERTLEMAQTGAGLFSLAAALPNMSPMTQTQPTAGNEADLEGADEKLIEALASVVIHNGHKPRGEHPVLTVWYDKQGRAHVRCEDDTLRSAKHYSSHGRCCISEI